MRKLKKNYGLFFNVLLVSGMVLFFSSCAREKGAVGYNNEKLRKQSYEIENSKPSEDAVVAITATNETAIAPTEKSIPTTTRVADTKTAKNEVALGAKTKEVKLSPLQKMIVKKLNKKTDGANQAQLEKNLKLAIIFGIVGLVLSIFGYPLYIIGGILIVVGLIFLLLWVLEQ